MSTKITTFSKFRDMSRKWSHRFFEKIFKEKLYGYNEKRLFPIIDRYMKQINGAILDAACGYGNSYIEKSHLISHFVVGMDIDPTVKERNKIHDNFIIGDLHSLQFDQKFDLIISLNTLEHLHTPQLVLKNFYNTLSNNGILIIIAPQRWHYTSIIERILKNSMKNFAWRILKGKDKMPYPAYYNLCSKRTLLAETNRIGFNIKHFSTIESPPLWFAAIPPLFIFTCIWMIIINKFKILEPFRSTFIAILEKNE
jgi:SAM-dependent methyltransferase